MEPWLCGGDIAICPSPFSPPWYTMNREHRTWAAFLLSSTAMSEAEFPSPITRIRFPSSPPGCLYWWLWKYWPLNLSIPSRGIREKSLSYVHFNKSALSDFLFWSQSFAWPPHPLGRLQLISHSTCILLNVFEHVMKCYYGTCVIIRIIFIILILQKQTKSKIN